MAFRGLTVLAVWALTLWLARRCPPPLALCTAGLLLAIEPFSRYGQEARPYAFVLAAAVACTILWTRLIRDGRRRWALLYALAVVAVAAAHLLAASLVLAHLVAAAVSAGRETRRAAVLRTAGAAALGLLVVSPFALAAARHGQGTRPKLPMTPAQLPGAVGRRSAITACLPWSSGSGWPSLPVRSSMRPGRELTPTSSWPGLPSHGPWCRWLSYFPPRCCGRTF